MNDKKRIEKTRKRLTEHCQAYPKLQIRDLFKYLYQSALGCEHMVSSEQAALSYLLRESATPAGMETKMPLIEPLDGAYSRVSLACLQEGLSPETLTKLFCMSSKAEPTGHADLLEKLKLARALIAEGALPFSLEEFDREYAAWEADGAPAIHHSDVFRSEYRPAYRVIANDLATFLPLFSKIDTALTMGPLTVAIEGGSASGKTTLASLLERVYDGTVLHADDFFLRPEQRTRERLSEIGGNLDRERLLDEVLIPLRQGKELCYRRFDCSAQTLEDPIRISPKRLTVVEGAYSMHPELAPYYDLSVFLDIESEYQRERITKRNTPQFAARFFEEWIPLEEVYFSKTQAKQRCDLSFRIERP